MLNAPPPKTNWLALLRTAAPGSSAPGTPAPGSNLEASEKARGSEMAAAMLRLARMAAELHRSMEAEQALAGRLAGAASDEEERAHGWARGLMVSATEGGRDGTEADR